MNWHPLRRRRAVVEREEAEAHARAVQEEVVRPLREMRTRLRAENHLTEAVARDMLRRHWETGP